MSFFSNFELPAGASQGAALDALSKEIADDEPATMRSSPLAEQKLSPEMAAGADSFDLLELRSAMADVRGYGPGEAVAEDKCMARVGGGAGRGRGGGAKATKAAGQAARFRTAQLLEKQKSSSTSTVFLESTMDVPDVDRTLLAMSVLLEKMIDRAPSKDDIKGDPFLACLTQRCRRSAASSAQLAAKAAALCVDSIFEFLKRCFVVAEWSPETNVIALVLLVRLVGSTETALTLHNWDKLALCALLLAQKLWDDSCLSNIEFPKLWVCVLGAEAAAMDVRSINALEKLFLEKLHYDVHVDRSTYTQVYFELHALCDKGGRGGKDGAGGGTAMVPITEKHAALLMARSRRLQSELDDARGTWAAQAQPKGGGAADEQRRGAKAAAPTSTVGTGSLGAYKSKGARLCLD
jgi:hypothetical protein